MLGPGRNCVKRAYNPRAGSCFFCPRHALPIGKRSAIVPGRVLFHGPYCIARLRMRRPPDPTVQLHRMERPLSGLQPQPAQTDPQSGHAHSQTRPRRSFPCSCVRLDLARRGNTCLPVTGHESRRAIHLLFNSAHRGVNKFLLYKFVRFRSSGPRAAGAVIRYVRCSVVIRRARRELGRWRSQMVALDVRALRLPRLRRIRGFSQRRVQAGGPRAGSHLIASAAWREGVISSDSGAHRGRAHCRRPRGWKSGARSRYSR
jgi:hypothetical protein